MPWPIHQSITFGGVNNTVPELIVILCNIGLGSCRTIVDFNPL